MKIQRTCTRLVKPSCTGPPLLVPLSNSDLVFRHEHVSVVYAYPAPAPPIPALEDGLHKVLCEYKEWAGRIHTTSCCTHHHHGTSPTERPAIQLNDAGAVLIEAEAHGSLQDLRPFDPSRLLLDLTPISDGAQELLLIQVTKFACGGMTLGIATQHQVADGVSAVEFTQAWAATVRGLPIAFSPLHNRSALMGRERPEPAMDHLEYQITPLKSIHSPNLAVKRLHFSVQLLRKVKAKAAVAASKGADRIVYSTFVSLLVHLWKCITIARGLEDAPEGETRAVIPINIRDRLDPPLPKGYFGNALCHTYQQVKIKDLVNKPLSFTASLIHDTIKRVDDDYARSALDFVELQRKKKNHVQLAQLDRREICVASWATLPLYNMDFGWGTPIFAGNPFVSVGGLVFFIPSHKQDGSIDVVLSLFAPHMEKLEALCYKL